MKVKRGPEFKLLPTAKCQNCRWTFPESQWTVNNARTHAKDNPGHLVTIEKITRFSYWMEG